MLNFASENSNRMAMTISSSKLSQSQSVAGGDGSASPSRQKNLPLLWTKVVRGELNSTSDINDFLSPTPSSPVSMASSENPFPIEGNVANDGDAAKRAKPTWNTVSLLNGATEVMGGTWPALSESTKVTAKTFSSFFPELSTKTILNPNMPNETQGSVAGNSKSNTAALAVSAAQSVTRGGGGGGNSGLGNFITSSQNLSPRSLSPPPPLFPGYSMNRGNFYSSVPPISETHTFDQTYMSNNRNPKMANNFSTSGNAVKSYNGNRVQPPVVFALPPFRPFSPMGYPNDYFYVSPYPIEPYRHPSIPSVASSFTVPFVDSSLVGAILYQIEYYFSDENLVKDTYLRSHMDQEGWVPISLIAGFNRVKKMTSSIQVVLYSLKFSTMLEIRDVKIRRRHHWNKWLPVKT